MNTKIKLPKNKASLEKEYFSWLTTNDIDKKNIITVAINAVYNVYAKNYTANDADILRKGLELNHMYSYAFAEYVHDFARTDAVFENLLLELSSHPLATVRFNIVTNCLYNYPIALVDTILENRLNDKSKKVRLKVADVLLRLDKESLLEPLQKKYK